MTLKEFFVANPKIALAFSGGVDSAYLLYAALEQGAEVKAYFIKSQFQPEFELEDARRLVSELAERFNRDEESMMCVISLDVLACDTVAANPADRCYYCKQRIFGALLEAAAADGFTVIMDGTNASDEEGDRPGMRALQELQVKSPLRLSGLTKDDVRQQSRKAGLFTWDKPSYACLATRIPTGQTITAEVLKQVEAAETSLETLGFRDFRIRLFHGAARIQLKPDQMELAIVKQREILEQMKPLFAEILLDMEGR
ncbi:MAG: ATP-dependent sacrificial sulfur transferase LarE [Firmicutes bacterium]|nr:ATP-dependent sacrificial sulfur transferase LarE [Bacillota bacterium]